MADKFVVTQKKPDRKEDKSVVMTLRIDRELQEEFDKLSSKSDRSRNELCVWLCVRRWNIWIYPGSRRMKLPASFCLPIKNTLLLEKEKASILIRFLPESPRQSYK